MKLQTKEDYLAFMFAAIYSKGLCEMSMDENNIQAMFPKVEYFDNNNPVLMNEMTLRFMDSFRDSAKKTLDSMITL